MKRTTLLLLAFISCFQAINAQRYIIRFKDKGTSPFSFSNPSAYLSQRAIERRQRFSISIDSTDLPITPRYLDSLRSVPGITILNASKWLNQVSIQVSDPNALNKINSFPFVFTTARIASRIKAATNNQNKFGETGVGDSMLTSGKGLRVAADFYSYGSSSNQIKIHNGDFLHNIGLRGQNVVIGMLDAGFFNYTSLPAFDSARINGQVLGTWDFVSNNAVVTDDDSHGMKCFSTIAANIPGTFVGSAPKASFYLFKTEDVASEYPIEEHNWVCGAERIDSVGGDLLSSSLGYSQFDDASLSHTYADLNGNTTMAAIGADLAAKKGILVVNSVGNEGNKAWHYLMTPADADSIIAVGAVNSAGQIGAFSSFGPSSDGQVKPDIASVGVGTVIENTNGNITTGSGTSYACPNIAGLISCLMQGFPEVSNMNIIKAIRQASNNTNTPDDRIGYGIPDMKKAVLSLIKSFASSNASVSSCVTSLNWTSKDMSAMKYEIERKGPNETSFVKIKEVSGTGAVFSTHYYQFTDALYGIVAGPVAYRIKQIIDTAAATITADYIDTITVVAGELCALNNLDALLASLKVNASSSANFSNCKTTISWTSSDIAAMKYEIERKTATEADYKKIAERSGTGTVFSSHTYQLSDSLAGVSAGLVSYRIRQIVDTSVANFKADYIDTVSVDVVPSCALAETFTVLPNPATNQFILQANSTNAIASLVIRISNADGQVMAIIKKTKPAGIVNYEIPISFLARGKYYISLYDNNKLLATKELIKL